MSGAHHHCKYSKFNLAQRGAPNLIFLELIMFIMHIKHDHHRKNGLSTHMVHRSHLIFVFSDATHGPLTSLYLIIKAKEFLVGPFFSTLNFVSKLQELPPVSQITFRSFVLFRTDRR
jgi:hypothetical protein